MAPFIQITEFEYSGAFSYEYVEWALANCRQIRVVCGPGVVNGVGTQPFHGPHSVWENSHRTRSGRTIAGRDLFTRRNLTDVDCVLLMHQLLATHRQAAALAAPTPFHVLLDHLFQQQVLERAYTSNVDGLEGRLSPSVFTDESGPAVVQVFGSIYEVRCETCRQSFPAHDFHHDFLAGVEVLCPRCDQGPEVPGTRRSARTRKTRLRPAVLLADEPPPLVDQDSQDATVDVLLLVGISVKAHQMENLVKSLAEGAQYQGRRVIYIGSDKLPKSTWGPYVDICLQVDPQEWATRQVQAMISQRSGLNNGADMLESFFVPPPKNFSLADNTRQFLWSGSPNDCCLCLKNDSDAVHPCRACYAPYCMQGPGAREIINCVQLGWRNRDAGAVQVDEGLLIKKFLCPACYVTTPDRPYPHLVRMPPFHIPDPERNPRLVLFVFFVTEFRFEATNVGLQIAHTWNERGWECRCIAISLDDLAHNVPVEVTMGPNLWGYKTYRVFAIYITHAMSTSFMLQTSATEARPVDVFLDSTKTCMMPILQNAASTDAVLLCCGHLFTSAEQVGILQTYLLTHRSFEHIVGFLNTKLTPSLLGFLLSWTVVDSLGLGAAFETVLVETWMRDELASTHTDLIVLSVASEPMVYQFTPFQSRPLGKYLPSVLHTCPCEPIIQGDKVVPKDWAVKHNVSKSSDAAATGRKHVLGKYPCTDVNRVQLTVQCTRCRRTWRPSVEGMNGRLFSVGGLYCVQVPYVVTDP